jgi:hypothetical protein
MYLATALPALLIAPRQQKLNWFPWVILGVSFTLFIGFRHEVGGDWGSYLRHYHRMLGVPFAQAFETGDPGYVFLNWWMVKWELGVYGVNLVCGAIFTSGLIIFCRDQPRPWLAFTMAYPYLIVMVANGYTRQSVALGLIFWALTHLEHGHFKKYVGFVLAGCLFHKTAVLMIPLGIFLQQKGWLFRIVAIGALFMGFWEAFFAQQQEALWNNYVVDQMQSQGGKIRVAMNFVPAILLLLHWKQWKKEFPNALLWLWMALAAIACVGLVSFATTAVDRIALYLTPLQVAVYSRLPYLMRRKFSQQSVVVALITGYGVVLYVWLNYATHAKYWLPYRNLIFE